MGFLWLHVNVVGSLWNYMTRVWLSGMKLVICKTLIIRNNLLPLVKWFTSELQWLNLNVNAISHNVRKHTLRHVRPGRFRSDCAFAQSDQNLHWAHPNLQRRLWSHCADVQADLSLPLRKQVYSNSLKSLPPKSKNFQIKLLIYVF